jgi:hypothetical protein
MTVLGISTLDSGATANRNSSAEWKPVHLSVPTASIRHRSRTGLQGCFTRTPLLSWIGRASGRYRAGFERPAGARWTRLLTNIRWGTTTISGTTGINSDGTVWVRRHRQLH